MTEQEIRNTLRQIQGKWYTPTSKIAKDINIHTSLVTRFINNNMQHSPSQNLLNSLEGWIRERQ